MDIPRPKLPKALVPKSLQGATVSDLGEEHASLLGEVIKELDFPEAEVSEDRNLSFLAELWLSEKMKGRGANREAMAKIEAIAVSAAGPFAHRAHPSHKEGWDSEGARGMKQSPGRARRVWERAKLGTAETISRVAWGSKSDYRMALHRLGLDENAKNVLSLGRYEKAYRQNVAKRYDWQGLFSPLLACQNAIRSDNDLAAASKALVSRFKAKSGVGKLEIAGTFKECQNAINSPSDIAPAWDEIARNCKEFSIFRYYNGGQKVFEDSARFANSPGDLAEIFSAYEDLRNAGAGVGEYNDSHGLPRVSGAFLGAVSSKRELLEWLGIATACVKDTVEIKKRFSSNELSDLKGDLQKITAIARNHEQLHEMRLLFEEMHSLTASSRKKAEAESTRNSERLYITPKTSLAVGAIALSSGLFSKPEMIREIARLVRRLGPEVEASDAISLLGAISPALNKPSDIAQAAGCVLRLHKMWQADLGSDGKPERLTYHGYFNSFREIFSRAGTLGKARHAIGVIESALAKGEILFSCDAGIIDGSDAVANRQSNEIYNIGSAVDGVFWHEGHRARIEKTGDSVSIYRILTLKDDFVYGSRKALPEMGNAKDGRSAWEIFEGLDLRKNSKSEDEKNSAMIALRKGIFKSADELARFETLVCEFEKRHHGWEKMAKIVTEISKAGHVETFEDFRMVLQGRELLQAIGTGKEWEFLRSLEGAFFKSAKECLSLCESFAAASQKSFAHQQAARFVMLRWNDLSQSAFFGKDPCSCIDKMAAPFLHSRGIFSPLDREGAESALSGYLGGMRLLNWEEAAAGAMRDGEAALVCRPNNMDGDYRLPLRKKGNGVELFWAGYESRDFFQREEQFRGFVSSAIREGGIKDADGLVSFIGNVGLLKSTIVDSYGKNAIVLPESQLAFRRRAAKSFEKLLPGAREEFFSALLDTLLPIAASKAKEAKTLEGMLEYGNRLFEAYSVCAITCPLEEFSALTKQLAEKGALASLSDFDSYAAVLGKVAKAVGEGGGEPVANAAMNPKNAWSVLTELAPRIKNAESVSEFGDYWERLVLTFNACEGKLSPKNFASLAGTLMDNGTLAAAGDFEDFGLMLGRLAKSHPGFLANLPFWIEWLPHAAISEIEETAPFAQRILAAKVEAAEIPETGFFFKNDEKLLRLLFRHPKSACALLDGQFHPVVALALASLDKEWSKEEILALGRTIPRNGEINNERYVRPVFVSFIDANPKLQLSILSHVLAQGIASRDDQKMLQLISFAHSLGEPFQEFFTKAEFKSMDDALLKAKAAAVDLLSQKYPRKELEKMPERDLARWLSVFPEFEQTMKIHHDENLIPALRALATIELMGKEGKFALHDKKLEAYLEKNAERLFPDEEMRPKIMDYLAAWRAMEDEKALFPGKSRGQAVAKLAEWKRPLRVEHVLEEISIVDRLEEAEKSLDSVFVKNHFCAEFVRIAGLYDGAATMTELADEYRRLKAEGAGRQELEAVVGRQNEIKKWSKLQSIFLNYEDGFEEARDGIAHAGRGLAPFETTLKEWGFDYGDSFGNKVFLGELRMLAQRCGSELKASPNDARLLELSGKIQELEQACSKGNDYVLSIAGLLSPADGGKKGMLAELYGKRDWAQGLLGEMEKEELGFEAALLRVEKEQPQLYGIMKETGGLDKQKLQDALLRYTDLTAITDLEAIVATARSEGSQKSKVFVYANQPLFSKVELAMVGQCLDYRYSKNSIGNAPFTVSYMDPWRQLLVAYPQTDEEMEHPKVNGIVFLAGISLEGKQETAVVMDTVWTSDKTDLGWSKLEGQAKFALQKASDMGMPLVVPDFLATYFDNIRELAGITGFAAKESEVDVIVLPGPAGATYCELKGYDHYGQSTTVKANALVLQAAKL